MKNRLFHRTLTFLLCIFAIGSLVGNAFGQAQVNALGVPYTEDFSVMGSSATAATPTGFKIGTDWSTGTSATTVAYGTTGTGVVNGSSGGGTVNWANGVTASSTDRSLGFLSTGSYSSPRSIIFAFQNKTGSAVSSITVTFNYEKFRSGTRAFDWTFFHGTTATALVAATDGNQSYAADANNTTVSNPPTSTAKTVTISGLTIPADGVYYLRWTYTGVGGSSNAQGLGIDDFSLTLTAAAAGTPEITSPASASAVAYVASSNIYQIAASNDPTSFAATGLPAGLSVDTTTGIISGTPTTPGSYPVLVSATNTQGTGSATVTFTVSQNPNAPVITSALTATTLVSTPFSYQIEASNSPTSYAASNLPTGLSVDPLTGVISGTPTTGGVRNISITATNSLGSDTQTLVLTVTSLPVITSTLSGSLYTTDSFTYTITATGTPTPTLDATGLPVGWTVTNGVVSNNGTPLTAGTISFQISASNSVGTDTETYTLAVFDQAAQNAIPLNVVVNKYVNASPDKVQLLVVGNGTPGSTVDMRGMIIKDFSGSNASDGGGKYIFADDLLWSAVKAGTLITLSAGTGQPEDIDPADFYLAVNLGSATYFISGGGSFDIATTDMLMIKAAGSGVSGVAGGIHALIGGAAGAQGTAYTGAKLRTTGTSGTNLGVRALNSTSVLANFGAAGQPESTDAQGGVAAADLNFTTWNNASNGSYVQALRGVVDGTGTAIVRNATGGSPFLGQNLFGRNLPAQTVEIVYTPTSATAPMSSITIDVPTAFGAPLQANVSVTGTGAESATVGVAGQIITISGLSVVGPNAVTVAVSGLATPDTATPITNTGAYSFAMQSQGQGGSLAALATSPSARVLIPIANVRNADPTTFVPVLAGQTVAVEGVCSVGRLGTGNTNSALQDATHGVTIFSQTAVAGPQNRGNRYAVVGAVAQFNGLVQLNLTDPSLVFDLGFEGDPAAVTVSVTDFNANGLTYQSRVIRIENLTYVSGTWAVGQNVILQDSSANQVTVRIQSASTAQLPTFPVNLTGIGGQFDNASPFDTGFQIQPRDQADAPATAPTITSSLTASATVDTPFSYQITATDNPPPTSYNATPLPAGLSIDGLTGLISGTPTSGGSFNVSISATNGGGTTTETLVLTVAGGSGYDTWASSYGLDPAVTTGPTAGAPTADPDGDTFNNAQEYAFGTNPTQGTTSLLDTAAAGGNLTVTWLERSDVTYNVQSTPNLATTAFANDATVTVVAGPTDPAPPAGYTRKQFTVAATGQKFYRVTGATPAP